jgi:hypothetical protein
MASVSAVASPSDMSAATLYTHERSDETLGLSLISGVTVRRTGAQSVKALDVKTPHRKRD